jgi:hypothetical protein
MAVCLLVGLAVWWLFAGQLSGTRWEDSDFFTLLSERLGSLTAWVVYVVGCFYFLSHIAVCLNLCASLAGTNLLPEVPLTILILLPLAAGIYLATSQVEARGRLGELLMPVLMVLLLVMIAAAAAGIKTGTGTDVQTDASWAAADMSAEAGAGTVLWSDESLAAGSFEVFACMGGMFLPILLSSVNEKEEKKGTGRLLRQAVSWSLIPAGLLLLVTAASFGVQGMSVFDFPAVRVMSNVTVPGGFLQRWDVLFLMLLILSLAFSVGSGFWYLHAIAGRLWRAMVPGGSRRRWETYLFWGLAAVLVFCVAAGFRDSLAAICYYRAFNLYLLTPLMIFVYLAFSLRKRNRIVCGAAGMLLISLLLTGCTARELEERSFPMALELRIEDGSAVMTYAWNEGGASGKNLLVFCSDTLSGIRAQAENWSERYIDYSHVKALILDEQICEYPELEQELYTWLAKEPAFAANLLIYPYGDDGLTLAQAEERSDGKIGTYLENLYKNNQKMRQVATTLGERIAAYYGE